MQAPLGGVTYRDVRLLGCAAQARTRSRTALYHQGVMKQKYLQALLRHARGPDRNVLPKKDWAKPQSWGLAFCSAGASPKVVWRL